MTLQNLVPTQNMSRCCESALKWISVGPIQHYASSVEANAQ